MDRQQEFVLRTIEERDIRFVRLWFTDVLGTLKSVAIAPAELEGAFAEGIGFDGSVIEGFARVYEADMLAKPDPGTFQVLPWRGESPGTARMFCDLHPARRHAEHGRPAPRAAARAHARPRDQGFTFYTHPEIEFFLLKQGWEPGQRPEPIDQAGYFDHVPHGNSHDFRRAAISMLETMGISVEFSHHEGAPGQNEIDLRYADALSTADNIMTFRTVVKEVALEQGIYATFMPKPFAEHPGSGMHTHLSLFEGDTNAFHEAGAPYQLCKTGRQFIAGLLRHGAEITAVTNQYVNSYKRLWGGGEAPAHLTWGHNNRSAMVRVPMYKPTKGNSQPGRGAHYRHRVQPLPLLRRPPRRRPQGHRGGVRPPPGDRGRRVEPHRRRAEGHGHQAAAGQPQRGHRRHGEQRARRRDPRGAHLRVLPPQQAGRVGRLPQPGDRLRARALPAATLTAAP